MGTSNGWLRGALVFALAFAAAQPTAWATKITLKDGRVIEGRAAKVTSMVENPTGPKASEGVEIRPIILVDDDLRRVFFPTRQRVSDDEKVGADLDERITLRQPVSLNGMIVGSVGTILGMTQFDEYGRRMVKMSTEQGPLTIIQGITEITPRYAKVLALSQQGKPMQWDQRIATSSIPPDVLDRMLMHQLDPKKMDQRLAIVTFYNQLGRYKEAEDKLNSIIADFPDQKAGLQSFAVRIHQALARRLLAELKTRYTAGQIGLTVAGLQNFPANNVAGETLVEVRQILEGIELKAQHVTETIQHFDEDVAKIQDTNYKSLLARFQNELRTELSINTLPRMATYRQSWADPQATPEQRVSLCMSGWLVGAGDSQQKLPVAASLLVTRDLLRKYLVEKDHAHRDPMMEAFRKQEAATPELVARLLANMRPPESMGEPNDKEPGVYRHDVPTVSGEPSISYIVQLPPEYDSLRQYPTVVALHGAASTADQLIDWWSGVRAPDGRRLGQGSRHGYIVIAPQWGTVEQRQYNFSAREHGAVLNSLRDACRRYSIDTDRVYLSGHSMGGDAAWDIGVSHPDLWAGVIPITAVTDKYIGHYWENASMVPLYLVAGERDGDRHARNARDLDRYMTRGYNVTVVEYLGRGHENFSDEVLTLFDWMGRQQRNFFPREIRARSLRSWDNYFYWLEMANFPSKVIVEPEQWPPPPNGIAATTEGSLTATNGMIVKTSAATVTVWLAPEIVNFNQKIKISVNGQAVKAPEGIEPSLPVMLEDARTRADRQHPFWAKVDMPGHKINVVD